ncbi:MAG: DsbA family oxidoreductase [Alphaproteobacteria bacterium]|jgi:predicted DsbA family dithiol-disulfide isomerase|nr:DsbA family oxidoreductase [Alphaproteobacteria bacterium]
MSHTLEMVSDLVCPWCWLGLRRLKAAMDLVPHSGVEILFRPYELDPGLPKEGVPYKDYMQARLGGAGETEESPEKSRFRAMREALEEYGEAEGIPFRFSGIEVRPNTFDAHRLLRWAQGQGLGFEAKEALFAAYFRDHRDIGQAEVLAEIAGDIGLDRDIVAKLLASDADTEAVRQEEALFQQMGVRGVPTYIGNRNVAVQGAENAEKLARFLETLAARTPQERTAGSA